MQNQTASDTANSQQSEILERLQQSTKSQHLLTKSFTTELIRCSNNHESIMACTNQKCLSYPFICSETKKCRACEQNHEHCMTFIKFEKLIHQIYRKKNKPQQVIEFLNDWFAKFIDLLSDTLDQLEMSLNSYGLTKKEESLLDLMQSRQEDKITGSQLNQVLKQIDSMELLANSEQQLLQNLKKQVQSTTKILTTQLSSYTFIIDSARQGKLAHIKNTKQKPQSWSFDRSHKFAKNFQFQHNDKTIMKQMQRGKYAQAIGNIKFDPKKDSQFSVMINSTVDSCIMFGIGSKDCQREDAHYSDKGIFYWGYSGKIWEKGCSYRGADEPFVSGDVITVRYSPDHKNVSWLKNHKVVASSWLPQKLIETQQLYPIFCILANGDKLTVFEDN